MKMPAAVVEDQVLPGRDLAHRLQQDPVGPESPAAREGVPLEADPLRVHERRTGHVVLEQVVGEGVVVGVHVVEAVAHVVDVVVLDRGLVGEGEVDPVADVEDLVSGHAVVVRVPEVDAVAPVRLDQVEPSLHPVVEDPGAAASLDVDSVERLPDRAAPDGHVVGLDQDAGHVLGQVRPGLRDVEPLEDRPGGRDVDDGALVAPENPGRPTAGERDRDVDDDVLAVVAGGEPEDVSGLRSAQDRGNGLPDPNRVDFGDRRNTGQEHDETHPQPPRRERRSDGQGRAGRGHVDLSRDQMSFRVATEGTPGPFGTGCRRRTRTAEVPGKISLRSWPAPRPPCSWSGPRPHRS